MRVLPLLLALCVLPGCLVMPTPSGPQCGRMPARPCYQTPVRQCYQYFGEIQHPYVDRDGRRRMMGDAAFRQRLAEPAAIVEPVDPVESD